MQRCRIHCYYVITNVPFRREYYSCELNNMWKIPIIILLLHVSCTLQDPVKVSIYYESLCPDSIRFILNQLHPAFKIIPNDLNLDFVPYGKAIHQFIDGKWQFECQHGPKECYGNVMQACALAEISNTVKRENLVYCIMSSGAPADDNTLKNCVEMGGSSWETVHTCGTSSVGDELLVQYGEQTHSVDPLITFIPTIIFNDVYNSTLQSNSLVDFLYTACSLLETKPTECPSTMQRKVPRVGFRNWFRY